MLFAGLLGLTLVTVAAAHQPYFEDSDSSLAAPLRVIDSDVSTALYSTLESETDVDWFILSGQAGQNLFLGMTIPQVEGQQDFDPTIALYEADGETLIATLGPKEATFFLEPFSNTAYWQRQRDRVALPASGDYLVKVWSTDAETGRYVLVVGEREVPGGDPQFRSKLKSYWTPLAAPAPIATTLTPAETFRCRLWRFLRHTNAISRTC